MQNWQPAPSFSGISTLTFESSGAVDYLLHILAHQGSNASGEPSVGDDPNDTTSTTTTTTVFPSLRKLNLTACGAHLISPDALCTLALKVLDLRPELHLECDSDFFASSTMSSYDRCIRYGARIYERSP